MRPLALIPLALCACVVHAYDVPVQSPAAERDAVEIAWKGGPAMYISVYRCEAECPDPASLPSYKEDAWPKLDEVWRLSGTRGHHAVTGILESPVRYGELATDEHEHQIGPEPLGPGQYLVRVVRGEGNYFRAAWGTGWSVLAVD